MDRRFQYVRKRLLRAILPGLRQLPPQWSAGLVGGFGPMEYALNGGLRARYHAVLGQAARHFGVNWDVPEVAQSLSRNLARWMTRDLLLDGWPDAKVNALFEVEGRDHLDRALARGQGVVLLFSHFGAHIHPTHWLMRQGYTVRWFSERPKLLSRFIQRDFETDGPTGQRKMFISRRSSPSDSATAFLRAKRALNAGLIVKAAGDVRWVGARTAVGAFLGRSYSFTTPWVSLAAISEAPVVPVFCLMNQDGSFRIVFQESFGVPRRAREPEQTAPWLRQHLHNLEGWLRDHPDNSNDYFFWYENDDCVVEDGPPGEFVAA